MRDGLPVVALVVSSVALVVALAGLLSGEDDESVQAPEDMIRQAELRLKRLESSREGMQGEIADLKLKLVRAVELVPLDGEAGPDETKIRNIANSAAAEFLRKRLKEEAVDAGAPEPAKTAEVKFGEMIAELDRSLKLDGDKAEAVHVILRQLRDKLNEIHGAYDGARREQEYREARAKAYHDLTRNVMTPEEYESFSRWRRTTGNEYAKRFFGL